MSFEIPTRPPEHLDIPPELERLSELAYNMWWTWDREARALFASIDPALWGRYLNPVRVLSLTRSANLKELAMDPSFRARVHAVLSRFDADMGRPDVPGGKVAYVSAEYALHECLPIYSGGLGVLSGDHLKEASDMALPLLGIGLLYRRGYFRQLVDADGYQQHTYPELDGLRLPILRVKAPDGTTLRVPVELPGRTVNLRVWVTFVGRVPLLLLDSYSNQNAEEDRYITSQLYVGKRDTRLVQEVVLGRGAVAVMKALNIEPATWHMNEGHSAFLAVEALRLSGANDLPAAIEAVRPRHVFTTHTPVPAGNEVFEDDLVRPYLEDTASEMAQPVDALMQLGRSPASPDNGFNLTALALRLSHKANGVAALHGEVSRKMWPDFDIGSVTNGIHVSTWLGREMAKVLDAHEIDDPRMLAERAGKLSDERLWAAHVAQKHRLMRFVRTRMVRQSARHGNSPEALRRMADLLEPNALTLGFARRFAPYKRADLLFTDPERLTKLLTDPTRPVQLFMAGKAHPADRAGQEIIRNVWALADSDELRGRIVFLEDYDMGVGRLLVRGVDVWLNTPEWPREASGTSGMKAAANGVLHASVPDGWWAEAEREGTGFTLGEPGPPNTERDAKALFEMLENEIVPLFYERDEGGLPRSWIEHMRACVVAHMGRFSTRRMLEDYARDFYDLGSGNASPSS
ncbi:MAG: alpha-glucan phosphorylase [Planctomycetota bacterium]|nr:MAG: alpha-glucan phosphorylase [Planctomycetota bacterium]